MQYPKQEVEAPSPLFQLIKVAFNSIDDILILFQEQGLVLETNRHADECCRSLHQFNVGQVLWEERLWFSEWEKRKCQRAFQRALNGQDSSFRAKIQGPEGSFRNFKFAIKSLDFRNNNERCFLLLGQGTRI